MNGEPQERIESLPLWQLKNLHGKQHGRNDVIADELRRRGLNSRELRALELAAVTRSATSMPARCGGHPVGFVGRLRRCPFDTVPAEGSETSDH